MSSNYIVDSVSFVYNILKYIRNSSESKWRKMVLPSSLSYLLRPHPEYCVPSSAQERPGHTGTILEMSHECDQCAGASFVQGEGEGPGPGE